MDDLIAGKVIIKPMNDRKKPDQALTLAALGLSLVPEIIARTPPYVDSVQKGSPAAAAGLRRDDLIVTLDSQLMSSCHALKEAISYPENDAQLILTVIRGSELIEVRLRATDGSGM